MHINASSLVSVSTATPNPALSNIVRQIKKLEQKKRKLQKQLSEAVGGGGGVAMNAPELAKAHVAQKAASEAEAIAAAGNATQQADSAPLLPKAQPTAAAAMPSTSTGSKSGDMDIKVDPKQIMKMIMMIDAQILALKQQLSNKEKDELAAAPDEEDEEEGAGLSLPEAFLALDDTGGGGTVESVAVEGGHVDGYA